jgi:anti-sigma regulatory factor (Ser/Thr protein kinase)
VPQARHAAVALAQSAGASARVVADVALAVSEACTNVVMHAYRAADAPGSLQVCARVTEEGLLEVVVADEGGGIEQRPDSPGLGMGMALMAAVTTGLELDHDGALTRVQLSFCLRGDESGGRPGANTIESVADPAAAAESEPAATDRD